MQLFLKEYFLESIHPTEATFVSRQVAGRGI